MGKYFGTDGIRGRANDTLTLDKAIKIGRYLGAYYGQSGHAPGPSNGPSLQP